MGPGGFTCTACGATREGTLGLMMVVICDCVPGGVAMYDPSIEPGSAAALFQDYLLAKVRGDRL